MAMTKGSSGKGRVSMDRVGKTNKPMSAAKGGSGPKKDSATNTNSYGGGSTKRIRSGDVSITSTNMNKYK